MSVIELLGNTLVRNDGTKTDTKSVFGTCKVVGLYFSANWCPPCRIFTPQLTEFYEKFKRNNPDKGYEIVYVSSDENEDDFEEYLSEMPWLAVPFDEEKDLKLAKLNKKFKVQSIPTLVLLDGGTLDKLTDDGRSIVLNDPDGLQYPWKPKPLMDIMSGPLILNDNKVVPAVSLLLGKVKGIYFSAHWCPPCKAFTPNLIRTYNKLKEDGKNFEIVFVTSDRSKASFEEYFGTMPWAAVPYGDNRCKQLSAMFGISGIPSLILIDENDQVITKNGRVYVTMDGAGEDFPWWPKPLYELNDYLVQQVNESACVILFTDGEEEDKKMAREALQQLAEEHHAHGEQQELFFFYGGDDEVCDTLRDFIGLEDRNPILIISDIPEKKLYVCESKVIDKKIAREFVKKYFDHQLEYQQLSDVTTYE